MTDVDRQIARTSELLDRTREAARKGEYEKFKTSTKFDGTTKNPHWLTKAEI